MLLLWQNLASHISVTLFCIVQKLSAYIKKDSKLFN